jgi:hypothetical protein
MRTIGPARWWSSSPEERVYAREDQLQSATWDLANAIGEDLFVQRDDEGNIGDGILRESRFCLGYQHISWGISPFQVAGEGYADCCTDAASIDCVALDHDDRPSVSRFGPGGLFQVSPPDFSLFDYHSTRRRTRRAARLAKGSDSKPTAATAWFIISVTRSGEWRWRNSLNARL